MIESLTLQDVASYGSTPVQLGGLSDFNFVYGANGCGKTTIGRVIAKAGNFTSCQVHWKGGTSLETLVYNRDFVDENFSESTELKGVFTLGEQNVDVLNKIAALKNDVDALSTKIEKLTFAAGGSDGSGGKAGEMSVHESSLKDQCWDQKTKHDKKFQVAFEGFRNNAEKFKSKVLLERNSTKGTLCSLESLETRAATIFGPTPTQVPSLPEFDGTPLAAHEKASILRKKVIGRDDVDIAAMIRVLGNSDWVKEGRDFFDKNGGKCPFCQQNVPSDFEKHLNEYFDETFASDTKSIDDLCEDYKAIAARLQQQVATMCDKPSQFMDGVKLGLERQVLDSTLSVNLQRLNAKRKEPSSVVSLEPMAVTLAAIGNLVADANAKITGHNKTVANLAKERQQLTADVWKYVVTELNGALTTYDTNRNSVQKALNGLDAQLKAAKEVQVVRNAEIRELEKKTTSIQPTIDAINSLLASFGFLSFSLASADDGKSYKLLRSDGSDAKMTLSEGERTFVTFLYFYHLLKGSASQSGMTQNRVVVFDDPVSSLDSDVLFIVGSLIKGIFDEVRSKIGQIKQVFVFTHNVYFHKEVTFNPRRVNDAMNEETFWIVRKSGTLSEVEKHTTNPIKTSYELLWNEVRCPNPSRHTIQNTLRRILENYFRILGGIDPDEICALFDGKEKLICRSLFSWVNDGSHYAHDDLYVAIDDGMVQSYLAVFKKIFEKSKHISHYEMMMRGAHHGDLPDDTPIDSAA